MKRRILGLFVGMFFTLLPVLRSSAATYYVNAGNPAPVSPYTSWATAATNIQDAINLSTNGDLVLVTNGIYQYGGAIMSGSLSNRVALYNPVTVESVNGPWVTTIYGAGATNSATAVRCAWLTNGATLTGFTLQGGATLTSGSTTTAESGGAAWCASSNALVANCVIVSNTAYSEGSGLYQGTVINSLVSSNGGSFSGGILYQTIVENCTIVSNGTFGVASPIAMTNCIIYYNNFGNYNVSGSAFSHCCTTPALSGTGNFTNAPNLFVDGVHLNTNSPCVGAGVAPASGTDIFGQIWANPPSIGCAELQPDPIVATPQIQVTGVPTGFTIGAAISGQPPFSCFWLDNGMPLLDNGHFSGTQTANLTATGVSLADVGDYQLVVSNSYGMTTSAVAQLVIYCVNVNGANPTPPYTTWATAATNIQDAVNASTNGQLILVTNGIYQCGGAIMSGGLSNRVALYNPVTVESVNGPWVTTIYGSGAVNGTTAARCAWLTNGAELVGFTLQGGATLTSGSTTVTESGGAAWCASSNALVANCVIVSNTAYYYGGAVYQGTVINSLVSSNGGFLPGGALYQTVVKNCTIVSNGTYGVASPIAMTNCIIYYNNSVNCVASTSANSHCCTTPALSGTGNFTNAPQLFADGVHLATNSPCIGAGVNIAIGTDIFGQTWSNPPSIGCAEWQPSPLVEPAEIQLVRSPVGFTVTAAFSALPPFEVFWIENGAPLQDNGHFSGTQTANLTAVGVNSSDGGAYQLVISNSYGMVTSAVAQLVVHCVNVAAASPMPPYTTWVTAAPDIQDAINVAAVGDIVLVTNGIYSTGGMVMSGGPTNRVVVNQPIIVTSVNGYSATVIQGAWDPVSTNGPDAVRCVWLANGALLNGFTLQNGATLSSGDSFAGGPLESGGGIYCLSSNGVASNCVLTNNSAVWGGGIVNGTLNNSLLYANHAVQNGGGVYDAYMTNCTVQENYVIFGGGGGGIYGTSANTARNSIVVNNYDYMSSMSDNSAGFGGGTTFSYSCVGSTITGTGNINVNPQFLDWYHIAATSPCRGAGNAAYSSGTDLDGEAWNNPPSMGCDEVVPADLVGPLSVNIDPNATNLVLSRVAFFWGSYTGRAATTGWSFGDGTTATNSEEVYHEWTNSGSYPVTFTIYNNSYPAGVSATVMVQVEPLLQPQLQFTGVAGGAFQFQFPAQNANYTIQYTTNLAPPISWHTLQTINGNPAGVVQISDPATTNAARFYRVLAQ